MKRGAQGWGEGRWEGGVGERIEGEVVFRGTHAPPNHFCESITLCPTRVRVLGGPFPRAPLCRIPGAPSGHSPASRTKRDLEEILGEKNPQPKPRRNWEPVRSRAAEAPNAAAGRCGLAVSRRVSGRSSGFGQNREKKKRKILHFSPPLPPFSPLCPSRDSPLPPQPTFSMTSFDEILQHRNLQASSAQDFLGVFWQDPVPAIQIASSDNKLRALPLRHNRFPQRSSKYLRVFISLLRER